MGHRLDIQCLPSFLLCTEPVRCPQRRDPLRRSVISWKSKHLLGRHHISHSRDHGGNTTFNCATGVWPCTFHWPFPSIITPLIASCPRHARQQSSNASLHREHSGMWQWSQKEPVPIPQQLQSGNPCTNPSIGCSVAKHLCSERHHKAYAAARPGLQTRAVHDAISMRAEGVRLAMARNTPPGVPSRSIVSV